MATKQPDDTVVADLDPVIAGLVGVPQYITDAGIAANEYSVRAMCAAVENANPAWWSRDTAIALLGAAYCPSTMLAAWGRPDLWEPGSDRPLKALQAHFDLKGLLGYSASVAVSYTIEFQHPVRLGERLSTQQVIRSIGEIKATRLGTGRFWTVEMQYITANSRRAGTETYEFFGFEKDQAQ